MAPAPIPAPRESGHTRGTNLPLYWCRYGPVGAPRVLVLHGGPGAHLDYLLPHLLDLADEFELLFYDQRGGGRSRTDDPAPITWQVHVGDLALVAAELVPGPVHLLGYSWGALLALLYAVESAGGRVTPTPASLTLIDPAPVSRIFRDAFEAEFARRANGPVIQAMRAELLASGLRERDPAAYKERSFELSVAPYFHDPNAAQHLTPFRVTGRVQQQVWESLGDFDLPPLLTAVRAPAAILHGADDPIPLASSQAAAAALGADLTVLEACGHVPYVERREACIAALRTYLRTATRGPEPGAP